MIQSLRGVYLPEPHASLTFSAMALDSAAKRVAAVMQVGDAGTLTHVGFRTATLTGTTPGAYPLRVRLETVGANGDPTGTLIAAGAEGTVPVTVTASTWYEFALTTSLTVTRGQLIALVVDIPTHPGTGAVTNIARYGSTIDSAFPYTSIFATTWTKSVNSPISALKIGGVWSYMPGVWPITGAGSTTLTGLTERGNRFTLPFACRTEGFWFGTSTATGGFTVRLRALDDTILTSLVWPDDAQSNTNNSVRVFLWPTEVDLVAGTSYRLTIEQTGANAATIRDIDIPTADYWPAMSGRDRFHKTAGGPGAWTDSPTSPSRWMMGLILSGVDDGAGGAASNRKVRVNGAWVSA